MKNLTIVVEDQVAEWARVYAARRGGSVSRVVGEMLRERMTREEGYEQAMRDWLSRPPRALQETPGCYPSRDELHDRR